MNDDDDDDREDNGGNSNARNTDPDTSKKAAKDIRVATAADRSLVYVTYKQKLRLADYQLDELLGGHMNGRWRKRRCDLKNDGLLHAVGKIINPKTRKEVTVWGLKETEPEPSIDEFPDIKAMLLEDIRAAIHAGRGEKRWRIALWKQRDELEKKRQAACRR